MGNIVQQVSRSHLKVILGISDDRKFITVNLSYTSDLFLGGCFQAEHYNDFRAQVILGMDTELRNPMSSE